MENMPPQSWMWFRMNFTSAVFSNNTHVYITKGEEYTMHNTPKNIKKKQNIKQLNFKSFYVWRSP